MAAIHTDIVIFGAGIAGLWTFHRLKKLGYDVLLLESDSIGGGQSISSQGIIHAGLKYQLAGKVSNIAHRIASMPNIWRQAIRTGDPVDLSGVRILTESQQLLIPEGVKGGFIKTLAQKSLGKAASSLSPEQWPEALRSGGFKGAVVDMHEMVLDIPSVIQALAEPYRASIRRITTPDNPIDFLRAHDINPKLCIFTAAQSNYPIAEKLRHQSKLKTQARPLLMGLLKPAPFELFAHCVGVSEKPVMTVTTHTSKDGERVWYIGGQAAERSKEDNPENVLNAMKAGFSKYLPDINCSDMEWSTVPIDRIEGHSGSGIKGWMPDMPTIHAVDTFLYCWPTKLTFAPLLSDQILGHLKKIDIHPSEKETDWSFLPAVPDSVPPWESIKWRTEQ